MFILMTYNEFPVYILEKPRKQYILPIGYVITHDPNRQEIFVKTLGNGLIPLSDLRYMNQNDRYLFSGNPELFSKMVLKEVPNHFRLTFEKEN